MFLEALCFCLCKQSAITPIFTYWLWEKSSMVRFGVLQIFYICSDLLASHEWEVLGLWTFSPPHKPRPGAERLPCIMPRAGLWSVKAAYLLHTQQSRGGCISGLPVEIHHLQEEHAEYWGCVLPCRRRWGTQVRHPMGFMHRALSGIHKPVRIQVRYWDLCSSCRELLPLSSVPREVSCANFLRLLGRVRQKCASLSAPWKTWVAGHSLALTLLGQRNHALRSSMALSCDTLGEGWYERNEMFLTDFSASILRCVFSTREPKLLSRTPGLP